MEPPTASTPGSVDIIKLDPEHVEEDFYEMMAMCMAADDDDEDFFLCMYEFAMHADKHLSRAPYRRPKLSGLEWVHLKLNNRQSCYNMFRLSPDMFYSLHSLLTQSYGLKSSSKSTSIEALGMFLWMLGSPQSARQAEDRFERSLGTVSTMFSKVLKSVLRLAAHIIKPDDAQFSTVHPRLRSRRFYPYFTNCIGAIDGTHVQCVVSKNLFVQHLCRKGTATQNVMVACDFDMRFTFVLSGWPGSVHDMRPFNDAITTYSHVFPHPPPGKYYLVDSGYCNQVGYLAPYKGTKYHLQEYRNAGPPQDGYVVYLHCTRPLPYLFGAWPCRRHRGGSVTVWSSPPPPPPSPRPLPPPFERPSGVALEPIGCCAQRSSGGMHAVHAHPPSSRDLHATSSSGPISMAPSPSPIVPYRG
ncbi:uncharacterized protein LOC120702870 isoform X2 [Panicum virgatum]|uniref:uncharacterized protein LOC120702870 isoform X2 n=1 Tax=Panicum virgatum TaxID=38727 RepID=UPI0019D59998|nr:uncharacterized protein LOC120702870 isoform X2 [Panicum virgatum]